MFHYYLHILSKRIRLEMPEIKQIELFNGQYINPADEIPLSLPAVFIEFGSVPWEDIGLHEQQGNLNISFHVLCEHLLHQRDYDLEEFNAQEYKSHVLDVVAKLHNTLQGWQMTLDEKTYSTELTRINTQPSTDADGLHLWIVQYQCKAIDDTTNRDKDLTPFQIDSFTIEPEGD